ncbi:MAG: CHASE4 domain-containing protein [Chloroflexota bacterium]
MEVSPSEKLQASDKTAPSAVASSASVPTPTWSTKFASLRGRTLLTLIATIIGLLLIISIPLRSLVLDSFLSLEEQQMLQNVDRASNALSNTIGRLNQTARDYAEWDATYDFIETSDPDYIRENTGDDVFIGNQLNLIEFLNTDQEVVFSRAFDLEGEEEIAVPEELQSFTGLDNPLVVHQVEETNTGVILLAEGPMLVASRPILTNNAEGPPRGTLLMGRYLTAEEVAQLSNTTQLSLQIYSVDDPSSANIAPILQELTNSGTAFVQRLDAQTIAGYTLLEDIYGQAALILKVETPRDIYSQGLITTNYLVLVLLLASLVFGVVILILLERGVLARLARLDSYAHHITESGDLSKPVTLSGRDEISRLAASLNTMINALTREQAERQRSLEERAQLQEELIRSKEHLTQMAVHDIKNPISAIRGYLDTLKSTQPSEMQRELISGARRSSQNVLDLVNNILDIARLEEGRLNVHREACQIEPLMRACAEDLRVWAAQEQKSVTVVAASSVPTLHIDVGLMRRVLLNLIANAIKHTPYGTKISVGIEKTSEGVRLWVWDNGPGIPERQQQSLFERFSVGNNRGNGQGDTGLGLTFCKLVVDAHGGVMSVESGPEKGTTFAISLDKQAAGLEE